MSNTNAPNGFQPFKPMDGSGQTQGQDPFFIKSDYTTPIGRGDLVILHTDGYVRRYAAASTIACLGVFWGCEYLNTAKGYVDFYTAWDGTGNNGDIKCQILTDTNMLFVGQATSTAIAAANRGENIDVSVGTPATSNLGGLSTSSADQSTLGTTSTLPWRVWSLLSQYYGTSGAVNGTDDASSYNRVLLKPNNWSRLQLTGLA